MLDQVKRPDGSQNLHFITFSFNEKPFPVKVRDSYIAHLTGKPDQPCFTIIGSGS